jgi:hypothetical protein
MSKGKPIWTWEVCPGSGYPPYRYKPGFTETVRNKKKGGRLLHAKAMCEVCQSYQPVNASRVLRRHSRKVFLAQR